MQFGGVETALLHLLRHKLAGADEGIDIALQSLAVPLQRLDPGNGAGRQRALHASLGEHIEFAGEAEFAGLSVAQTGVGGAQQLVVVQGPHHAATTLLGKVRHHGRDVAVNVVQMHHIGLEIIEYAGKRLLDVAHAQRALHSSHFSFHAPAEVDFTGKIFAPLVLDVLGVLY